MAKIQTETRGIIDVPLSEKERAREWREKKERAGGKSLTVWLEPETAEMVDALLDAYPRKNKKELVAWAIQTLYEARAESGAENG